MKFPPWWGYGLYLELHNVMLTVPKKAWDTCGKSRGLDLIVDKALY